MLEIASQPPALTTVADATTNVVFTFSYGTWQTAARRGWFMPDDRLARTLMSHERVGRLLVCDLIRSLPLKLARDCLTRGGTPFPADERHRLLRPVRARRSDPASIRGVARAFAAYDRALRRAAGKMELEDPVVITAHPLVAGFAELSWARAVTYYATDDWSAHPAFRRWWPAYRESYARIRALGRRVGAVSPAVLESMAPAGPSAVIPNGLEPADWVGGAAPPAWVGDLPRPLLVYAGMLDSRLDITWLRALALARPDVTIVLVGPVVEPMHIDPLRAMPNIAIRPPLGRREVTGLIRAADVGLIPHVRSRLTEGMSPLKLYEYLAAGLPVAATDLAPIRGVDARVVLVREGGDFAAGVGAALELGPAAEDERLAFVEAHSWRTRHERLLDLALA